MTTQETAIKVLKQFKTKPEGSFPASKTYHDVARWQINFYAGTDDRELKLFLYSEGKGSNNIPYVFPQKLAVAQVDEIVQIVKDAVTADKATKVTGRSIIDIIVDEPEIDLQSVTYEQAEQDWDSFEFSQRVKLWDSFEFPQQVELWDFFTSSEQVELKELIESEVIKPKESEVIKPKAVKPF